MTDTQSTSSQSSLDQQQKELLLFESIGANLADGDQILFIGDPTRKDYQPSKEELKEFAIYLGMDGVKDKDLFWIASEAIRAPLPPDWRAVQTTSDMFYFNIRTNKSTWDSPTDEYYRQLYIQEKAKMSRGSRANTKRKSFSRDTPLQKLNRSTSSKSSKSTKSSKQQQKQQKKIKSNPLNASQKNRTPRVSVTQRAKKPQETGMMSPRSRKTSRSSSASSTSSNTVSKKTPRKPSVSVESDSDEEEINIGGGGHNLNRKKKPPVSAAININDVSMDADEIMDDDFDEMQFVDEEEWGQRGIDQWETSPVKGQRKNASNTKSKGLVFKRRQSTSSTSSSISTTSTVSSKSSQGSMGTNRTQKNRASISGIANRKANSVTRNRQSIKSDSKSDSRSSQASQKGSLRVKVRQRNSQQQQQQHSSPKQQQKQQQQQHSSPPSLPKVVVFKSEIERLAHPTPGTLSDDEQDDNQIQYDVNTSTASSSSSPSSSKSQQNPILLQNLVKETPSDQALLLMADMLNIGQSIPRKQEKENKTSNDNDETADQVASIIQSNAPMASLGDISSAFSDLRHLTMTSGSPLSDSDIMLIADSCTRLQMVSLSGSGSDGFGDDTDVMSSMTSVGDCQPSDIGLEYLFKRQPYIVQLELDNLELVHGDCFQALATYCQDIQTITLTNMFQLRMFPKKSTKLADMMSLDKLTLRDCVSPGEALPQGDSMDIWIGCALIRSAPNLRYLEVDQIPSSQRDIRKSFNRLEELRGLKSSQINDKGIRALCVIATRISKIDISPSLDISQDTLQTVIKLCPALESLIWTSPISRSNLQDVLKTYASRLRELHVNLQEIGQGKSAGNLILSTTQQFGRLEKLVLQNASWISDQDIMDICQSSRKLSVLDLKGAYKLTGQFVVNLGNWCRQLTHLSVDLRTGMSGVIGGDFGAVFESDSWGMSQSSSSSSSSTLSTVDPGEVASLNRLQFLHISYSHELTMDGLNLVLRACPELRTLSLIGNTGVDGTLFSQLSYENPKLEQLCLKSCRSIQRIDGNMMKMDQLHTLIISFCTRLKQRDLVQLKKHMPGLTSVFAKGCDDIQSDENDSFVLFSHEREF